MPFKSFAFLLFVFPFSLFAQSGCTDVQALNYDAGAVENDGSCLYPFTPFVLPILADLPLDLREVSGLAWVEGKLYGHSDEGAARLYEIDPGTGAIMRSISILGGPENLDWEDMAVGENYIYIGEFGNNSGNRMDLKIYRLDKSDLQGSAAFVDVIEFAYADQSTFNHQTNQHNFDCEAMIFQGDSLHLFSKNWLDGKSRHYVLPATPGSYLVPAKDSFDVGGFITGADIGEEGVIALLGRTEAGTLFSWLLFDYPEGDFFGGNKRRIFLGEEKDKGQVEGIAFRGGGQAYIGSEEKGNVPARLYVFASASWTGVSVGTKNNAPQSALFTATPNPFRHHLQVKFHPLDQAPELRLYNTSGQLLFHQKYPSLPPDFTILLPVSRLPPGCYLLEAKTSHSHQIKKLIKS